MSAAPFKVGSQRVQADMAIHQTRQLLTQQACPLLAQNTDLCGVQTS